MPTIRDVARACGVSTSTISQVLSNNRPVAQVTREKVLRTMREMKYHPSAVARGLSIKRMNTIGIVIVEGHASPIKTPYFNEILDGIFCTARDHRQNATVFLGHYGLPMDERINIFCDSRSDGLLLIAPTSDEKLIAGILERDMPFVVVADGSSMEGVTIVDTDHVPAARALTEYLLSMGHRRIGMVVGSETVRCSWQRLDGYRHALEAHGIPFDQRLVAQGSFSESIDTAVRNLMRLAPGLRPTAIFCANDSTAINALQTLKQMDIQVPKDVSIVGFDDLPFASESIPPLTTMRQKLRDMGVLATERLLGLIEKRIEPGEKILLEAELVIRDSATAPAPQSKDRK